MSDKLALIQSFYDRVWVQGAVEEAPNFFDTTAEASGLMPDFAIGGPEFHEFVGALLEQLVVTRVTLEKAVEDEDWISVMATFDATVQMTGQSISGGGMLMARIVDGKIVEAFNFIDFLGLFEKMGLVPENALALCMTGQRLG